MQDSALLHTIEEAGGRLKLGRSAVYELITSGELESVKIGRARRIPEDALVAFVEKLRGQSTAA